MELENEWTDFFFLFLGFLVYRDEKHSKEEKKTQIDYMHEIYLV